MPRHVDPDLVKALEEMGCEITPGRKHKRILYQGRFVGPLSTTPSDVRSSLNTLSHVRRVLRRIQETEAAT